MATDHGPRRPTRVRGRSSWKKGSSGSKRSGRAGTGQLTFDDYTRRGVRSKERRGVRRVGRPKQKDSGVPHLPRAPLASRFPVHVTVRIRGDLPSLRHKPTLAVLRGAFAAGCDKGSFRLNHFTVQATHVHMVVEASDREGLSRGLQGLLIRMARALNRRWGRRGKVFADRYHDRILRSPREVRNVLAYVLRNHRHHGCGGRGATVDPYSSGAWFDGWRERVDPPDPRGPTPVAQPRTWLQTVGWRRHGLLGWALGG